MRLNGRLEISFSGPGQHCSCCDVPAGAAALMRLRLPYAAVVLDGMHQNVNAPGRNVYAALRMTF